MSEPTSGTETSALSASVALFVSATAASAAPESTAAVSAAPESVVPESVVLVSTVLVSTVPASKIAASAALPLSVGNVPPFEPVSLQAPRLNAAARPAMRALSAVDRDNERHRDAEEGRVVISAPIQMVGVAVAPGLHKNTAPWYLGKATGRGPPELTG